MGGACLGMSWVCLGLVLGYLGFVLGRLGPVLGYLGLVLGVSWACLRPSLLRLEDILASMARPVSKQFSNIFRPHFRNQTRS